MSSALTDAQLRKIGPVYDAVDSRQFKQAVKLADKYLEKYAKHPLGLVLKSYALLNLPEPQHKEEARKILQGVKAGPAITCTDTLHVLSTCLRVLKDPEGLSDVYEKAAEAAPTNEAVLTGLFAVYLNSMNPIKLQQVALRLTRAHPASTQYTWWSVVAILLQAREAALKQLQSGSVPPMPADKLIDMAITMIEKKAMPQGGVTALSMEPLLLYVEALRAAGKYTQAAAAVRDATKALPIVADRKRLEAQLLGDEAARSAPGGRCPEAAELYRSVLEANPDDWEAFVSLVDALEPATRQRSGSSKPDDLERGALDSLVVAMKKIRGEIPRRFPDADATLPSDDALLNAALSTLKEKAATSASASILRTPGLALVEVALRKGDDREIVASILAHLGDKGHMVSCPADLRVMLRALPDSAAAALHSELEALAASTLAKEEAKSDAKEMRRGLAALQLLFELGTLQSSARPELGPLALLRLYGASRGLFNGLDQRERGPTDDLPALAAHCTVSSRAHGDLVFAALALEGARLDRPYSAQILLPLTSLWALLACGDMAVSAFDHLDVKNVQMDSIASHLLQPTLLALGGPNPQWSVTLRRTLALHSDHLQDSSETMLLTFKHGTYTKSVEFADFRERIENSHARAVSRAEQALLALREASLASVQGLLQAAPLALKQLQDAPSPSVSPACLAALRFNEDLSIRPTWYGPEYTSSGPRHALQKWWAAESPAATLSAAKLPWRTLGSAEFASMEAWRDECKQALVVRWNEATAMAALVSLCASPLPAGGADAAALSTTFYRALQQLLASPLSGATARELVASPEAVPSGGVPAELQLLSTGALWALEGTAASLAAARGVAAAEDSPTAEEEGVRTLAFAGRVQRCVSQAVAALPSSSSSSSSDGQSLVLLRPTDLSYACQLAREDLPLIAGMLGAAARALQALHKTQTHGPDVAKRLESSLQSVKSLAKAVNDALGRLQGACSEVAKTVKASLNRKAHAALTPERLQVLSEAFPSLEPLKVLRKACEGQAATLEDAAKSCKETIATTVGPLAK